MKSVKMNFAWELLLRTTIFLPGSECDLDVIYRCIIARAREEYQVGRFPLLLFQDNPFERQAASYVTRDTITSICALFFILFLPSFIYLTTVPENPQTEGDKRKFYKILL